MSLPPLFDRLALPVIGSPLFLISNPDLVIAQCKAGIVGSFPALNARPTEMLEEWLKRIIDALGEHNAQHPDRPAAPFAVNQIVHRTNERLSHDLDLCVKYRVPLLITSLGAREDVYQAAHSYGGIVLHDVINDRFARKAIEKGADGLVAVAAGAGGHAGTLSPFALIQEIRQWFDGPLALSGAMATGGAILAAQAMGADLAVAPTTLSIPISLRAYTAIISSQAWCGPGLTRRICPSRTPRKWILATAAKRGKISGARDKALAPSNPLSQPLRWFSGSPMNIMLRGGALLSGRWVT
jgi:hypothetical protein